MRLWGQRSATEYQHQILENFLALVTVVRFATMRSTSEQRIKIVEEQLQLYLSSFVELYSATALHPNHHMSLHLPECLRAFGPVHGWWAFPFERYNGILQQIETNNRRGEL